MRNRVPFDRTSRHDALVTTWRVLMLSGAAIVLAGSGVMLRATSADDQRILLFPALALLVIGVAVFVAAFVIRSKNDDA